ncbi:hypothetical protein EUC41_08655 [Achromobacter denitrificans]|uniref:hypothetical protein n=1 Tax=Achromobacter denitrificans TaxID=32002 RepID=UPI00240E47CE|nr:hypothetical protein [Achromobacter denitrificans]WFC66382.1 hypothetical protein EUC41_08655 [Achromobacter denitrificans]
MQTDRELLELAARANWAQDVANDEVSLRYCEINDGILYLHADNQDHNGHDREFVWNPLTDDGDAFRLSAKLGLEIRRGKWPSGTRYVSAHRVWNSNDSCYEDDGIAVDPAPYAATRLAIVRAAASLAARPKRHNDGADRE